MSRFELYDLGAEALDKASKTREDAKKLVEAIANKAVRSNYKGDISIGYYAVSEIFGTPTADRYLATVNS